MANGFWKGVYRWVFGRSSNFCLISFSIRALLLSEKVAGGEKTERSRGKKGEKNDKNSVYYIIANSQTPERRVMEHHMLVPKRERKKNVVFGGHYCRCQSAARMPTNWTTACLCQNENYLNIKTRLNFKDNLKNKDNTKNEDVP